MAEASYVQTSFLGGEISEWAQGRFDLPKYKIALAEATNIIPVDEGAAPRRPGTKFLGTTRNGAPGRQIPFDFAENSPYNMEFTDGFLRFWNGTNLVTSNDSQTIASVSNGTPAVFTVGTAVTWATGDQVYFTFASPYQAVAGAALLNRQYTLTMLTTTTFTVTDSITGVAINGSVLGTIPGSSFEFDGPVSGGPVSDDAISGSPNQRKIISTLSATVNHIAQIATPYSAAKYDWHSVRSVQGLELATLLHAQVPPQALEVVNLPTASQFATFEYSQAFFQDGPYLDPPSNAIATPSGTSGVIQVVVGYPQWVSGTVYGIGVPVTYNGQDYVSATQGNSGNTPSNTSAYWTALAPGSAISASGFVSTDVGRMMRLYSCPQNWSSSTTYAAGATVTYNGSQFTSLINSNTNNEPDISLNDWVINTSAAIYTWGLITAVLSANTVSLQLYGNNLLYTTPCPSFQIGAWSNTTGWPTCGCYYQGRFWFGGAIPNRFDSSSSNSPFNMAPTELDGTVVDSNGISYTLNSNTVDQLLWMEPQVAGMLVGTQKGEYLISSGTSGGPITPSSIVESPATRYGSSNMLPVKTGLSMCFVQRLGRRLLEYLADVFSQRFYGPDLTTFARHLGARQFEELAYQQEPAPIVWARMNDGSLVGNTYRRVSLFSNQEPEFSAWHKHVFGSGRLVESICVGPSADGTLDTLSLVSNDPSNNIRFITSLTPMLDETDPLTLAWFLDSAVTPGAATFVSYVPQGSATTQTFVRFYGLQHLNGRMASVFAAAIDCGDYLIENGSVDIPLGTADPTTGYTFDIPQFNLLQPQASSFSGVAVAVTGATTLYSIPCVVGFNYQSQGQLCRPMLAADTGARTGPGFAKKRRTARYGINLVASLGVQVGTNFNNTYPVPVTSPGGKQPPYLSTYTGIRRETIKDDFSFDSMLCWQTTRPLPATVTAFGGFITTEDV